MDFPDPLTVQLFPATPGDTAFLGELFRQVRAPEFASLGLPAPALEQLLEMQWRAQRSGHAAQFPDADDAIVWAGDERAGRWLLHRGRDAIRVVDVALLQRFRKKGIGTRLLEQVCREGRERRVPVLLTVRFDNPAAHLYARAGFVQTASDGLNTSMEYSASGAAFESAGAAAEGRKDGSVTWGLGSRYFQTLVGKTLLAQSETGLSAPLLLQSVEALRVKGPGRGALRSNDSFALRFTGPLEPRLPDRITALVPEGEAALEVFLVAHGPLHGRMTYDATINRISE